MIQIRCFGNKMSWGSGMLGLAMLGALAVPCPAQSPELVPAPPPAPTTRPPVPPPAPPDKPQPAERLETLIRQLHQQREALQAELEQAKTAAPEARQAAPDSPPILQTIEQQLRDSERERAARLTKLRLQIQQLQALLRRRSSATVPPASLPPDRNPAIASSTLPQDDARPKVADQPEAEIAAGATRGPLAITDQPVDRIALANNLFGSGEIQLALEIYENVRSAPLDPDDEAWVYYQMAGCHRKLDQLAKAEKNYRIVAGLPSADFLAKKSRWWLDAIQKRKDIQQRLGVINTTLQALEQELDEPSNN